MAAIEYDRVLYQWPENGQIRFEYVDCLMRLARWEDARAELRYLSNYRWHIDQARELLAQIDVLERT